MGVAKGVVLTCGQNFRLKSLQPSRLSKKYYKSTTKITNGNLTPFDVQSLSGLSNVRNNINDLVILHGEEEIELFDILSEVFGLRVHGGGAGLQTAGVQLRTL